MKVVHAFHYRYISGHSLTIVYCVLLHSQLANMDGEDMTAVDNISNGPNSTFSCSPLSLLQAVGEETRAKTCNVKKSGAFLVFCDHTQIIIVMIV